MPEGVAAAPELPDIWPPFKVRHGAIGFLRRHPTHVFVRASKAGIVFHPHGYTVVGRNRDEVMYLNATARRLLRQFAEESTRL